MAKGFGIAALVVAIIAIFVPMVGIFVSGAALLLATIAALAGDKAFAVATALIAGVNTFVLSPTVMNAIAQGGNQGGFVSIILVCLAAPFVAMALNASGKVMLGRKSSG